MAGIGFELQRVLRKGGLGSLIQVAFAGIMIVAGPWLLSIGGIFFISEFAASALLEGRGLFISVVVYCYAFSLLLFGGFHYLFTRIVADQIYEEKRREAGASLLSFSVGVILVSALVAGIALSQVNVAFLTYPELFRSSSVALFAVINLLWVMMIFVSLLKNFAGIIISYFAGMAISVVLAIILGGARGLGGAMLGFVVGQLAAALFLAFLLLKEYRPAGFARLPRLFVVYFRRYRYLFLSGMLYFWGIWVDKIVFWIGLGSSPSGSFLRLYDAYDVPVYLASLTMIPGLIYFVVVLETDFYLLLMDFLKSLQSRRLTQIQERKYTLRKNMNTGLREQSLFQGMITLGLVLIAAKLLPMVGVSASSAGVFRILLVAVFFHFLLLTLMTFLLYMELFRQAFVASALFFLVNLAGSLLTVEFHLTAYDGMSYLLSAALASAVAYLFLDRGARRLDRAILARYSGR